MFSHGSSAKCLPKAVYQNLTGPVSSTVRDQDIVITGLGPVSAIGCGREVFWRRLVAGRHGIRPITICDVATCPSRIGAEIDFDLGSFVKGGRRLSPRMPRPVQLALAASALCLEDGRWSAPQIDRQRLGVCVGTSVGNFGSSARAIAKWHADGETPPADTAFAGFNHAAACVIASYFDIRGPILTVSTGCNSGLDALGQARRMIQVGDADAVLAVGTDSELVTEIIVAMCAAGALATRYNDSPGRASRPFDRNRDGNVIGEGAGALLLESRRHASRRKRAPYARVAAYASSASGRHRRFRIDDQNVDVRPCATVLRETLRRAGWAPEEIDAVNANGSSSVIFDRVEALALRDVLGEAFPSVGAYSIKSMLGQHGAGSSALQAIAACLSLAEGCIPPTLNCDDPDPLCGPIRVSAIPEYRTTRRILVHSIGLGGYYYSGLAVGAPGD